MVLASAVSMPALAQSNNSAKPDVDFCKAFSGGGGKAPNQGTCTAFFQTPDPVSFCAEARAFGTLELYGFRNQGECIAALRKLQG